MLAEACVAFEAQAVLAPMEYTFGRSRKNKGLDQDGNIVGGQPSEPVGTVVILGRLQG